ncbi:3-hydroxyacyl-CoA dehydrogenase NAD-binding domain-containing protein [Caulobacter soli]|uniref:3-hydroxyacyl-CoA dehydrogenase NAD-binding domain-containing protein n=1 Tax=Caulobacter soli TaxID=2708539 RepID=UPI0013ECAECE|nr:3-hydroxyacyl-CoA dehydrogenase NAD-binding domain-containing protein [Caulobacter soli]
MDIQSNAVIVIVGAGAMGAGVAQVAALAGHPVRVIDRDDAALARGRASVDAGLASLARRGALTAADQAAAAERIAWTTDLARASDAALAIEAIVERLDVKAALFAQLAAAAPSTAILASNTSSLSIQALAAAVTHPERFLGLHFFNPVPAMKLVEVIGAAATSLQTIEAASALMSRWGKHPVTVRDVPGFIVNRVARPYYAEGFAALAEGAPPAAIDHALTAAGGFRMGPLALADLIGHDVNYAVATSVYEAYDGVTRFRPQAAQQALVEAGALGRKSGSGVYDYARDLPAPDLAPAAARPNLVIEARRLGEVAPLAAAASDAGVALSFDAAFAPDVLEVDGIRIALGDGRALASRTDADVLLDAARDFSSARTLVMTAVDDHAAATAAGFVQAIGKEALFIADRPGLLVLRTLAQLANAAADAAGDEVASLDGIDEAMVLGANHPEGPLAWARRYGVQRLASALTHIAAETADPLYRPSPFLLAAATSTTQEIDLV